MTTYEFRTTRPSSPCEVRDGAAVEGWRAAVTTYVFRTTRPSSPCEVQDGGAVEGWCAAVTTYVFRTTRPSSPCEVRDGGAVEGRSAAVTTRHRVQSNVHARAEHATHQWAVVGSGLRNRAISTDCVSEERNKKTTLSVSVSARPRPFVSGRFRGEPSRTFGRHHVFICTFGHVS